MKDNLSKIIEKISSRLPDTPGIIWEKNYSKASVLIPLVLVRDSLHLLFEKRSKNIRQASEICFPGGKFDKEKDNSLKETALRETEEEIGVKKESIMYIGQFNSLLHHMGLIIESHVGFLNIGNIDELSYDSSEVEKVFTIPVKYFQQTEPEEYRVRIEAQSTYTDKSGKKISLLPVKELGLPSRYLEPWGNCNHKVIVYKTEYGILWGMTAKIACEFCELL